jgi:hypothetical protein
MLEVQESMLEAILRGGSNAVDWILQVTFTGMKRRRASTLVNYRNGSL